MTPADIERLPQNQEVTDESRLIDFAPIARQTNKVEKIDKPEVVYKPTQSTTTTSSTATTFTTTTTSIATTEQETTTTEDPIASHVNFLLQQYFSTQTPHTDPEAIPMITYDDENQSIVMEYVSPDGEHGSVDKLEEPVQIPTYQPAKGQVGWKRNSSMDHVLAVRTAKADVMVGLEEGQAEAVSARDVWAIGVPIA